MGACLSYSFEERKAQARSDEIDKQLLETKRNERFVIRMLLLGAGESGKSTLVKQMKIIHSNGFTADELLAFRTAVLENLVFSMKFVLSGMGLLRINLQHSNNKANAQVILSCQKCYNEKEVMLPVVVNALGSLWTDGGVRKAVSKGYEFELNDSAIYYFENMHRICAENYRPNQQDVLRVRIRTTGVIETCFTVKNYIFRMYDVGGQRSERKKWVHCFDNIQALLYVVALSGYDMTLSEDPSMNRLEESMRIFQQICRVPFFWHTSLVIFLNKMDLFHDKITRSKRHLKYFFHDYDGPKYDSEPAAEYLQNLFTEIIGEFWKYPGRVFFHRTTATDTNNVKRVFDDLAITLSCPHAGCLCSVADHYLL